MEWYPYSASSSRLPDLLSNQLTFAESRPRVDAAEQVWRREVELADVRTVVDSPELPPSQVPQVVLCCRSAVRVNPDQVSSDLPGLRVVESELRVLACRIGAVRADLNRPLPSRADVV